MAFSESVLFKSFEVSLGQISSSPHLISLVLPRVMRRAFDGNIQRSMKPVNRISYDNWASVLLSCLLESFRGRRSSFVVLVWRLCLPSVATMLLCRSTTSYLLITLWLRLTISQLGTIKGTTDTTTTTSITISSPGLRRGQAKKINFSFRKGSSSSPIKRSIATE